MKKLYVVTCEFEAVAAADDLYQAEEIIAREVRKGEIDLDFCTVEVTKREHIPRDWALSCVPYGDESNTMLSEWLSRPVERQISVMANEAQITKIKEALKAMGIAWVD